MNTIGNLTLVAQRLNRGELSNRPWTDAEATPVATNGKYAKQGKRMILAKHSLLLLNKDVVDDHPTAWTNDDILQRSHKLAGIVAETWSAPPSTGDAPGQPDE